MRRPLYSSSVGKWRRYAQQLEPLRQALGGRVAAYETRLAQVMAARAAVAGRAVARGSGNDGGDVRAPQTMVGAGGESEEEAGAVRAADGREGGSRGSKAHTEL